MAIEIEAKMSVIDLDAVRTRLQELRAESHGSTLETNTFFDTEDRSLLAADEGLRLRKCDDPTSGQIRYIITFKGPRRHGAMKSREELELGVESDRDAVALLTRLGYLRVLSFEKRRESWVLDGCNVELDSLPYLGNFVEIEGPNEQAIMEVRAKLNLNDRPMVKNSYIALLMTHLRDRNDTSRAVTFESVRKSAER